MSSDDGLDDTPGTAPVGWDTGTTRVTEPAPTPPRPRAAAGGFEHFAPTDALLPVPEHRSRRAVVITLAAVVAVAVVAAGVILLDHHTSSPGTTANAAAGLQGGAASAVSPTPLGRIGFSTWVDRVGALDDELSDATHQDRLDRLDTLFAELDARARALAAAVDTVSAVPSPAVLAQIRAAGIDLVDRSANLLAAARAAAHNAPYDTLLAEATAAEGRFETEREALQLALTPPSAATTPSATSPAASAGPLPSSAAPATPGSRADAEAYVRATIGNPTAAIDWTIADIDASTVQDLQGTTGHTCLSFVDGVGGCGTVYERSDLAVPFVVLWVDGTWQFFAQAD